MINDLKYDINKHINEVKSIQDLDDKFTRGRDSEKNEQMEIL
jgi:hypothetical protein